jgi:hypothetical protein
MRLKWLHGTSQNIDFRVVLLKYNLIKGTAVSILKKTDLFFVILSAAKESECTKRLAKTVF